MLGDTRAMASFSVDDVTAAREFYGETLGLTVSEDSGALWLHLAGEYDMLIYPKPDHIPASYTILNFAVEDIDEAVDGLVARGVRFLRFDEFGADDKGIVRGPRREIAWFSDPAGNVLSVVHLTTSPPEGGS
jgi:predicted enzyme related to lactoylglutathione lyase